MAPVLAWQAVSIRKPDGADVADKLEDLRIYVAVIDSGGVNAAAAALGIAKSAVSRRLGELEERLGATLVQRTTRSFEPTPVGRRYYEGARSVLKAVETLDAGAAPGDAVEPVRVTVATDAALRVSVSTALAPFARDQGAVVEVIDPPKAGRRADTDLLWVGVAPTDADAYDRLTAGTNGMLAVAAPALLEETGRPATFADLRAMPGIAVPSREDGGWRFGEEGKQEPRVEMAVPDDASAVAAAIAGAGVARVTAAAARDAIAAGRLEQVLAGKEPAPARTDLWMAKDAGDVVRRVAEHLAAALAAMA